MATNVFRSMADTMSGLAASDFEVQLYFFISIHKLMKEGKLLRVMEDEKQEIENPSNNLLKSKTTRDDVSVVDQERMDEERMFQQEEARA
ncbi:hypothetical protein DAPPUDRAFT_244217 [Daphnia pulex]|uniref:Uncharacterized protein n=1 Tax=Daphnia pulex TaxID=6669 RepID=E9GKG4_DAPPU|nr:hypothetical protein DAPPUDRAFT_244217 [Daphnia pulex]|eukprot:EFX80069.1 hypothetical protein DAPPUDRAFT_244217 [Daphnia pulex]